MSNNPSRARSTAAMLPECEPPRTTLGAPIRMSMPAACRPRAASIVVGDFATQMQEVIGAQQTFVTRRRDRLGQDAGAAVDLVGALLAPDPQRIQHRGDA